MAMADQIAALRATMNEGLEYNETGKARFERASKKYLRNLAKQLELKEFEVRFNRGGIAVSGDAILMGMWGDGNGIYISINQFGGRPVFMYRSIKHMKDYTGGQNLYIWGHFPFFDAPEPINDETVLERLLKLRQ